MNDEVLFKNAPKDSALFRVSKDNLYVDPDFSFKSMLESTDLLAYYDSVDAVVESKEFKTCLVSIETCLEIFFLDFFKLKSF
jgi:hypothetical protein